MRRDDDRRSTRFRYRNQMTPDPEENDQSERKQRDQRRTFLEGEDRHRRSVRRESTNEVVEEEHRPTTLDVVDHH